MNEYISKQKVIDYLNGYLHSLGESVADTLLFDKGQRRALINSIQDISAVKAADVQPVKHGRWIITDDVEHFIAVCSECGRTEDSRDIKDMLYCHCGARMDSE